MAKKVKEKTTKSTNIDLDNEIIIGIKTLPEIEPKKKNKKKTIALTLLSSKLLLISI